MPIHSPSIVLAAPPVPPLHAYLPNTLLIIVEVTTPISLLISLSPKYSIRPPSTLNNTLLCVLSPNPSCDLLPVNFTSSHTSYTPSHRNAGPPPRPIRKVTGHTPGKRRGSLKANIPTSNVSGAKSRPECLCWPKAYRSPHWHENLR